MKFSILLAAGLVSAFPQHVSRRHAVHYHRTLRDRGDFAYDAVHHYPRALHILDDMSLFAREFHGTIALAKDSKTAGPGNIKASGSAAAAKDNAAKEKPNSSTKDASSACKLGKRAPGTGCGQPNQRNQPNVPNNDWNDIVGPNYLAGSGSNPNSWEMVKPAGAPSHQTENPTHYPVDLNKMSRTARVLTHASTHPIKLLTGLAKVGAPVTVGFIGSAATKNPKLVAAGMMHGYGAGMDSIDQMDKAVKDKAKAWIDGTSQGHTQSELNRMQGIDNGVKATGKVANNVISSAGSAASKGWGALRNTASALGNSRKGSSTSASTPPATPATPARQNTDEFEMVEHPVRARLIHPCTEDIQQYAILRRRLIGSLQARYLDERIWS